MVTHDDEQDGGRDAGEVLADDPGASVDAALAAIADAVDAIEAARQHKRQQQEAFAAVLRHRLHDLAAREAMDDAADLLGRLYWDEPDVRVADLQAASGLSGADLRRFVGPREVDVRCASCGRAGTIQVRSRSASTAVTCGACVERAMETGLGGPTPSGPAEDLTDLFEFLVEVLDRRGCDNRLTLSRVWASHAGRDPDALARSLERLGGYCDCEVLHNVARIPPGHRA